MRPRRAMSGVLAALVGRLERAECGSRELTADIYEALGYRVKRSLADHEGKIAFRYFHDSRWLGMRDLTTNLADSLCLLPAGAWWIVAAGQTRPDEPLYGAQIRRPVIGTDEILGEGEHRSSPELAFCIAALMATLR